MRKSYILYVFLIVSSMFISCTRELDESVNITIDTSSLNGAGKANSSPSSQSVPVGFFPTKVIANLHFDGRTEVATWSCGSETVSSCFMPGSINFNNKKFPNGAGRVVQVLLVYENEQEQMLFYYAHALNLNFSGGAVNVTISDWVNNGGSPGTANIAGRYYDKDAVPASGPTGRLIGSYSPPRPVGYTEAQIPDMKLFSSYMFNGYFNLFFLKGATKFTWTLVGSDGSIIQPIFTQKSLEDFTLSLSTKRAVHVVRPGFYSVYQEAGGFKSDFRAAEDSVLGFFKSSAAPGSIEYYSTSELPSASGGFYHRSLVNDWPGLDGSPESVQNNYRHTLVGIEVDPINSSGDWVNPANPSTTTCSGACTAVDWAPFTLMTSLTSGNTNRIRVLAGDITDSTYCSAALTDIFNLVSDNCFKVLLGNEARNGLAPFRGPFSMHHVTSGFYTFVSYLPSMISPTTQTEIKWSYLPGMGGLIDGTEAFLVNKASLDDTNEENGFDCPVIATTASNISLGSVNGLTAATQKLDVLNATIQTISEPEIVLCPFKMVGAVKTFIPFGVSTQGLRVTVPLIDITTGAISPSITQGTCTPVQVNLSRPSMGNTVVTVNSNVSALSPSIGCGAAATTSVVLSYTMGDTFKTFYIDAEATGSVNFSFTVSGDDTYNIAGLPAPSFTITAAPTLTVASIPASPVNEGDCIPFVLNRNDTAGSITVTLPVAPSHSKFIYYSDGACATFQPGPTVVMSATVGSMNLSMKAFSAANQVDVPMNFTAAAFNPAVTNIDIIDAAAMIFVTQAAIAAGTTGVTWGDTPCTTAATAAGLPMTSYKAILSVTGQTALSRISAHIATKPIYNTRGELVTTSLTGTGGLFDYDPIAAPVYSELGDFLSDPNVNGFIWTGTDSLGAMGTANCGGWLNASSGVSATVGAPTTNVSTQLQGNKFINGGTTKPCDGVGRLYCVGN